MMPTIIFSRDNSITGVAGGYISADDWSTNWNGPGNSSYYGAGTIATVGEKWSGPEFQISRTFLGFDTTELPSNANILAAKLRIRVHDSIAPAEPDAGYSTVHVVEGVQSDPIVDSDYGTHRTKTTSGGSIPFTSLDGQRGNYIEIELNSIGISWITKAGNTKFCLRLAGEKAGTEPTGINRVWWDSATPSNPELVITYVTSDALTRVTNLIHRYVRKLGVFTLEMNLGSVTSEFALPDWPGRPIAAIRPADPLSADDIERIIDEKIRGLYAPTPMAPPFDLIRSPLMSPLTKIPFDFATESFVKEILPSHDLIKEQPWPSREL